MLRYSGLLVFICFSATSFAQIGEIPLLRYYWRDFNGHIPPDAFIAAFDSNGGPLFVGQAYIKNGGIVPCEIHPDVVAVQAPIGGSKPPVVTKGIKILCGASGDFEWIPTNISRVFEDTKGKKLVIGGFEDTYGNYNVGRVKYNGEWKIGKVNTFWPNTPEMFFANGEQEIKVLEYEILAGEPLNYAIDIKFNSGREDDVRLNIIETDKNV